jgi:hypothetical protein
MRIYEGVLEWSSLLRWPVYLQFILCRDDM